MTPKDLDAIRNRHLRLDQMKRNSFHTGDIEMDLADCVGEIELLRKDIDRACKQKDGAYAERNKLVALVSKLFPSCLGRHEESDTSWEDDWRWIVYVTLPTGQCSWHIHDSDLPLFAHLSRGEVRWDGHTTDEKYARIVAFGRRMSDIAADAIERGEHRREEKP